MSLVERVERIDRLLAYPFDAEAAAARSSLMRIGVVVLLIAEGGLVPEKISALGIVVSAPQQRGLEIALALGIAYLGVRYAVLAAIDYLKRAMPGTHSHDEATTREPNEDRDLRLEARLDRWPHTLLRPLLYARKLLDLVVPMVLAVWGCLVLLL